MMFRPRELPTITLFVLASFLFPVGLQADVLELRNGRKIEGRVVGQSATIVLFRSRNRVLRLKKKRIRRIGFGETLKEKNLRRAFRRRKARARRAKRAAELKKIEQEEKKQLGAVEKRRRLVAGLDADLKRLDDQERNIRAAEKALAERKRKLALERRRIEEKRRAALGPDKRREKPEPAGRSGRMDRLWRSALVPGWGQYHGGRKTQGAVLLGGFAGLGALMITENARFNSAAENYAASTSSLFAYTTVRTDVVPVVANALQSRKLLGDQKAASARTAFASTLFIGAYIYNLVDAWFFGGSGKAGPNLRSSLDTPAFAGAVQIHAGGRGLKIGYKFSF